MAGGIIAHRLAAARDRAFVGRRAELTMFKAALAGETHARPVQYLQGPGGVGKSMLLRRFAHEARRAGRVVTEVDGRTVTPTPAAFQAAASAALHEPRAVLLVDTFEKCQGLEGWLWGQFLPQMADGAVAVVAGRSEPDLCWAADPGWTDLLQLVQLRGLSLEDAADYLRARGVPTVAHDALLTFAGGNPLVLALAAAVAIEEGAGTPGRLPSRDAVAELLPQLVGEPPSPAHRRALEICSHASVTTESILRALLGTPAPELFAWLRAQPFIEATPEGVFPHDAVRAALEADLRWRDPDGFADMHRRIQAYLLERVRSAPDSQVLFTTGALKFLHRSRGPMPEVGWRDVGLVEDRPYAPDQRQALLDMVAATEGAESAAIAAFWLDRRPEAFRVFCSTRSGHIVAFMSWLRLDRPEGVDVDPVVAAAWRHAQERGPVRPGEHIAVARFLVSSTAYHRPSASMTFSQWRICGEMIRADRLSWSYIVASDDGFWNEHLRDMFMVPIEARPQVGERRFALFGHDWRSQPADLWMRAQSDAVLATGRRRAGPDGCLGGFAVLSHADFKAAVRDALRSLRQPDALAGNPLHRTRLVVESGRTLPEALSAAVDRLAGSRAGDKRHRALTVTYFGGSPTQEAAAQRLQLPWSTYRRHLASAIDHLSDLLWHEELCGITAPATLPRT